MKFNVELSYKGMPTYSQVAEVDDENIIEAKLKATKIVKGCAYYGGWKSEPKRVKVTQIF